MHTPHLGAVLGLGAGLMLSLFTAVQAQVTEDVVIDPQNCASISCPLGTGSICCALPRLPTAFCGPGGRPHLNCQKSLKPVDPLPLPDEEPLPLPRR